jgi:hypothetical protein
MEFLYSLNRLNVATSRAKCVSIIVSSPRVFEAECRTPRQVSWQMPSAAISKWQIGGIDFPSKRLGVTVQKSTLLQHSPLKPLRTVNATEAKGGINTPALRVAGSKAPGQQHPLLSRQVAARRPRPFGSGIKSREQGISGKYKENTFSPQSRRRQPPHQSHGTADQCSRFEKDR